MNSYAELRIELKRWGREKKMDGKKGMEIKLEKIINVWQVIKVTVFSLA